MAGTNMADGRSFGRTRSLWRVLFVALLVQMLLLANGLPDGSTRVDADEGDKRIARAGLLERRGSRLRTGGLSTAELVERFKARKERRASGPMSRSAVAAMNSRGRRQRMGGDQAAEAL